MPDPVTVKMGGKVYEFPDETAARNATAAYRSAVMEKFPEPVRRAAEGLLEYRIPLPTGRVLDSPFWRATLYLATELDPNWDVKEYGGRQRTLNEFRVGAGARAVRSFNTVIQHLSELKNASKALDNTRSPVLNKLINWFEREIQGDPAYGKWDSAITGVASELESAFRPQSGGTEQGVREWRSAISREGSPEQQREAMLQALKLLSGQVRSYRDAYNKGMGGESVKPFPFLSEASRGTLSEFGLDPNEFDTYGALKEVGATVNVIAPDGTPGTIPRANLQKALERGYKEAKP